jgi:hypothetical protein
MKKMMISSIAAAILLLGTMNSNAQSMNRNDKAFDQPRQEIRMNNINRDRQDMRMKDDHIVMQDHRMPRPKEEKVVVVREPEPRPMPVVEALPPLEPRRVHVDDAGTTIAAAAVGAVVGAVVSVIAR